MRLAAFTALALFDALHWAALIAPGRWGAMLACAAVALAVAGTTQAVGRLGPIGRAATVAAALPVALVVLLVAAGVPGRLLTPARWGSLASGIGQGIQSLPGIGVPYGGVDPWVRIVLVLAGGALLVLAALLAVRALRRDRRPLGAAAVLATTYVIAVVERVPSHPALWGALFTILAGALLWGDRIERAYAGPALLFAAVALIAGTAVAPRLEAGKPWINYQAIIESLSTPPAIAFDWNHGYGPLHWPRDNREMLRVSARTPVYWKAVELNAFNGTAWRVDRTLSHSVDTEVDPTHPNWRQRLRVTVRDLRSTTYVGAGTALSVEQSPRVAEPSAPGTFTTGNDPLRRGDSYLIDVYTPHPTALQMADDTSDYPSFAASSYLSMDLPQSVGGPKAPVAVGVPSTLGSVRVRFEQFGLYGGPSAYFPVTGQLVRDGSTLLEHSRYAAMYALAQQLREQANTPYQFIRAVEAHLASDYSYTESPPPPRRGQPPLVSFLFDSHAGYCQQFSGAMALLLRMGGVPARVASGFTPGTYDNARGEWVARDVDAHSWVEAYFPRIGWVTFDPTPAVAPPHDQLANGPAPPSSRQRPLRPDTRRADVPKGGSRSTPTGSAGSGVPIWLLVLGALAVGIGGAGTAAAIRSRRRDLGTPPELAELTRALRRTGRPAQPGTTLQSLERRYARQAPGAAAYVAAVRLARYGGGSPPPTAAQRAALRSELAAGLGWGGRLRAWWALPPAGRRPGSVYTPR
jgi:transglutaminase-like putative cysteine protease